MTLRLRAMIFVYIFLYICGIWAKEEIKSHEMKEHYDALTQHEKWVEKTDNGRKRSYIIVDSNANANPYSDHNPDNPYNYNPRLLEELEQARKASEEQMYLLNSTSSLLNTSDAFVEADLKEEMRSYSRRLAESLQLLSIPLDPTLTLYVEPPDGKLCSSLSHRQFITLFTGPYLPKGYVSEKAFAVFVRCSDPEALVYYALSYKDVYMDDVYTTRKPLLNPLTLQNKFLTYNTPYIQVV
jgi:hypothetical protein